MTAEEIIMNKNRIEIKRLIGTVNKLARQLEAGKFYLMGVSNNKITVEDTLEAFGFGRNGLTR